MPFRLRSPLKARMIKKESNRETHSPGSFFKNLYSQLFSPPVRTRFNDLVHCICLVWLQTDQIMPWINQDEIAWACLRKMGPEEVLYFLCFFPAQLTFTVFSSLLRRFKIESLEQKKTGVYCCSMVMLKRRICIKKCILSLLELCVLLQYLTLFSIGI